jgi:hypothetical protein
MFDECDEFGDRLVQVAIIYSVGVMNRTADPADNLVYDSSCPGQSFPMK